jgi:uncharacterized membrane protein (UPF0127 family)
MKRCLLFPTLLCLLVIGGGCRQPAPATAASGLPVVTMAIGNKTFVLEVANKEEDREHGLMRRDSMAADHGMIFVFVDSAPRGFYMKNTRIPLDIVFVGEDERVVSIKQMQPYDLSTTPSDGPAKWAIELNQGAAAKAGLKVGDNVNIPESARTAEP